MRGKALTNSELLRNYPKASNRQLVQDSNTSAAINEGISTDSYIYPVITSGRGRGISERVRVCSRA